MIETLEPWWSQVSTALAVISAVLSSVHVVLHKRDVRSAAGWVGLILLVPIVGALLYLLLGINRIRRRAVSRREGMPRVQVAAVLPHVTRAELASVLSSGGAHLADLAEAIGRVTARPLLAGNRVDAFVEADTAFSAMLEAIEGAERSIVLSTYIFDTAGAGARFVSALVAARARGIEVRVLVDDVGARYSVPRADRVLRRRGVRAASFMPAWRIWRAPYINLRNHRKLLIVDGMVGFTGGMNIRTHLREVPIRDLHFRVRGPVVAQLAEVFADDWAYATKERLTSEAFFRPLENAGAIVARGIADGPDEDLDKFTWTLHSALACARRSVTIMTPYFLPDTALATALNAAALRGVSVRVIIPRENNLRLVQWAMGRQLEEVLGLGCEVWLSPTPFEHTKLMIVDGEWTLLGSANWDTRSLRLNFELDVECYDLELAHGLEAFAQKRLAESEQVTLEGLRARPAYLRIRDGFARLLMPYL